MAELKTKQTDASVEDFFKTIADENVRADARRISGMMEKATGSAPAMWGHAIVGFGHRQITYASGRELDWMVIGFSPRKQNLTLYLSYHGGMDQKLLAQLGKHKTGKGCLYIKRVSDIDEQVLEKLIEKSIENNQKGM